jgi:ABC-type polar amino acid transport system ATPase subunit
MESVIAQPLLRAKGLCKSFGEKAVLKGVDLEVSAGEVVFIIGPSGSGKSTLLRSLNLLDTPSGGIIQFAGRTVFNGTGTKPAMLRGRELHQTRGMMPMVFQHFNLFKHKTILGNVIEGPLVVQRRDRDEVTEEAKRILERIGLGEKCDAYPPQLSGGQQQRAAIARAVALRPKVILFDEPTSALDPELVLGVLETIRALADDGMTMVIVTHEMSFARRLANRIYFMVDGLVVESGSPVDIFEKPKSERLKTFLQPMTA